MRLILRTTEITAFLHKLLEALVRRGSETCKLDPRGLVLLRELSGDLLRSVLSCGARPHHCTSDELSASYHSMMRLSSPSMGPCSKNCHILPMMRCATWPALTMVARSNAQAAMHNLIGSGWNDFPFNVAVRVNVSTALRA